MSILIDNQMGFLVLLFTLILLEIIQGLICYSVYFKILEVKVLGFHSIIKTKYINVCL